MPRLVVVNEYLRESSFEWEKFRNFGDPRLVETNLSSLEIINIARALGAIFFLDSLHSKVVPQGDGNSFPLYILFYE